MTDLYESLLRRKTTESTDLYELIENKDKDLYTSLGRPTIINVDGTRSTERNITITDPRINQGRPTNIPSLYGGKEVSEEEAIQIIAANKGIDPETGRLMVGFDSVEDAIHAAKVRSEELGGEKFYDKSGIMRKVADVAIGTGETGLQFAKFFPDRFTSAVGAAVYSAYKGIEGMLGGEGDQGLDTWLDTYEKLNQTFAYHSSSESAAGGEELIGSAFQKLADVGQSAGDAVYEKTGSPALATAIETSITGSPFIAPYLVKGGMGVKNKISALKQHKARIKEVKAIMEDADKGTIKTFDESVKEPTTVKPRIKLKTEKPSVVGKKAPPIKTVSKEDLVKADAKSMDTMKKLYEKAKEGEKKATQPTTSSVIHKFMREVFDRSEAINRVANKFGESGKQVMMYHQLRAGASTYALDVFHKTANKIYDKFSSIQKEMFDQLVLARRVIQIDKYKPGLKHPVTPENARGVLRHLKRTLSDAEFQDLWQKSDLYFAAYKRSLGRQLAEGLITKEDYANMHRLIYQPRIRIESLGVKPRFDAKGRPISVKESGIKELGKGQKAPFITDSKYLLAYHLLKTENRIANNKANVALYNLARDIPDNGMVRIPKVKGQTPTGGTIYEKIPPKWEKIYARVEGKRQPLYVEPGLAEQWKTGANFIDPAFINVIRKVSLTNALKFFATGPGNPGFFVTDFPRALITAWTASSEFSSLSPKALGQMTMSLGRTAKDAFTMRGNYYDTYIREGGGMNFLSDEGAAKLLGSSKKEATIAAKQSKTFRRIIDTSAHLNRSFELWSRLATMERAMLNGKSATEATWVARNITDFAKGGRYAKAADAAIPYTNSILQVFRSVAQEARKHPAQFVAKGLQVASIKFMWDLANMVVNPEMWEQLSDEVKVRGIVGGAGLGFTDNSGNKRYPYWEVRLDGPTAGFNALGSALAELVYYGTIRNKLTSGEIKNFKEDLEGIFKQGVKQGVIPIAVDRFPLPPSVGALVQYLSNYDSWKDDAIWKGGNVLPEDEIKGSGSSNPTPLFWRYFGESTGMSPERLRNAAGQIVPPNPFTYMVGHGIQTILDEFGPEKELMRDKITKEYLAEFPVLRRVYNLTHPAIKEMDNLEEIEMEGGSERARKRRTLEDMMIKNSKGDLPGGSQAIRTFIMGHRDPNERQTLIRQQKVFNAWEKNKQLKEVVPLSRAWWTASAGLPVKERAIVFHDRMSRMDSQQRKLMLQFAQRISVGRDKIAYYTPDFRRELNHLIKEEGLD